jgi:hypothetical protein
MVAPAPLRHACHAAWIGCRTVTYAACCMSDLTRQAASPFVLLLPAPAAGLPSQVPEVQGLALGTTCKLAAAAGPELLRPHMPLLVPAMLESLRCGLARLLHVLSPWPCVTRIASCSRSACSSGPGLLLALLNFLSLLTLSFCQP